jgi:hypothetical protein
MEENQRQCMQHPQDLELSRVIGAGKSRPNVDLTAFHNSRVERHLSRTTSIFASSSNVGECRTWVPQDRFGVGLAKAQGGGENQRAWL